MKHVGKMKNNGAKVAVAYRTLPGDPLHALVIGTGNLPESYHDSLMSLIQSPEAQQAKELYEVLDVRSFPDGNRMLQWLHSHLHLKKVPTSGVLMTPTPRDQDGISLDMLNQLIAEQKELSIDELAVTNGSKTESKNSKSKESVKEDKPVENLTPTELRSKADALFKEAQKLRKQADEIDPPKKKTKKVVVDAENAS